MDRSATLTAAPPDGAAAPDTGKRLVFVASKGKLRFFASVLGLLADRGHKVHVSVQAGREKPGVIDSELLSELSRLHPNVTSSVAPGSGRGAWQRLAQQLRFGLDYLFYLQPQRANASTQRVKIARLSPKLLVRVAALAPARGALGRRLLTRLVSLLERSVPLDRSVDAILDEHAPDLVAVSPLTLFGTAQVDVLRSAKARGVHTIGCIASWDNLTSGGWIREWPELVTVWNRIQRSEAVDLHGLPAARVAMTGAQAWDPWFESAVTTERAEFCAKVGLPVERPFLLFVGSTGLVGPEAWIVRELLQRARQRSSSPLAKVNVLVRPHPFRSPNAEWSELAAAAPGEVAVWPPQVVFPTTVSTRSDYYDSIHHSAAVLGINTSAFVEGAIVGRSCHTIQLPELARVQEGLPHFHYLKRSNGGPLHLAASWEELLDQLSASLTDPARDREVNRSFVASFVRPHGIETPAAPKLVATIESLLEAPAPAPQSQPSWTLLGRALLAPVAHVGYGWAPQLLDAGRRALKRAPRRFRRARRRLKRTYGRTWRATLGLALRRRPRPSDDREERP